MKSSAEFWLDLHRIAAHLQGDEASEDRIDALATELESIPPATREVFLGNLEEAIEALSKLNASCERLRTTLAHPI